jgi:hypothetical protein
MTNDSRLDAFLERARRAIGAQERRADPFTDEIRDHLMTAIDDLRRGGMDPREAEQMALERFGAREAILKHHEWEAGGMTLWLTPIWTVLAAVTTFVAAVVVIHSLAFDDGSAAVETVKVGQSALIIVAAILTLRSWSTGRVQSAEVMVVVAIWLLVSGAAAAVWTIHLASTTGDLEAWAVLANLMVAAQGASLAWMAMTRSAEA